MLFLGTITEMTAVREFDSKDRYGVPCRSKAMDLVITNSDETIVASVFDGNVTKCAEAQLKAGDAVAVEVKFSASESTAQATGQKFWNQRVRIVYLSVLEQKKTETVNF